MQKYFKIRAESVVYKIICIIAKSFQLRIHKFTYFSLHPLSWRKSIFTTQFYYKMYKLDNLNKKKVSDLKEIAKGLNIPKAEKLLKSDLVYQMA